MRNFEQKVVVITGAGSGIGRALALQFAKEKARLALNDFDEKTLDETIAQLPEGTSIFKKVFDVSDKVAFFAFAKEVNSHFGQVDVLINNAGVAISKLRADEVSIEDYEWIIGINLWGVIYGSQAFLPFLRKQAEATLVNISSAFGLNGIPFQAPYCTTKFAVRGFTESLELEERFLKTSVTVACVHPGGIKTNIAKAARKAELHPEEMSNFEKALIYPPSYASNAIVKGIRKKKTRILVGNDAKVFFLLTKLPKFFVRQLLHFMFKRI